MVVLLRRSDGTWSKVVFFLAKSSSSYAMNPRYSEAIKALRFFVGKYTFKNKFRIIVKKCTLGNFRSFFYLFFWNVYIDDSAWFA